MSDKIYSDENSFRDNDNASFTESGKGFVAKRVVVDNSEKIPVLNGVDWEIVLLEKPDSVTEIYTYWANSVLLQTVTIIYETSCKKDIISVVKNVV